MYVHLMSKVSEQPVPYGDLTPGDLFIFSPSAEQRVWITS